MNEALLQFLWRHSLYSSPGLKTTNGEPLVVINSGRLNRDSGPDFSEAKIRVGDTILVGNIEMHVRSSDWIRHGHAGDRAYNNLILHAVYEHDAADVTPGTPTLELKGHISADIVARYSGLVSSNDALPCSAHLGKVKDITRESWLSRLLAERWEHKLAEWNVMLQNSVEDWSNLLYWRLAANFGFKTNAVPFLMLAQSLPLNIPTRHKDSLVQLEALFFGQAGMLDADFTDEYPRALQREYDYLRKKYSLKPINPALWKFMRMRPANFPTIRIAQFAALVHKSLQLFSKIIETHSVEAVVPLLDVKASEYWDTHFRFDEKNDRATPKALGKASIENVVINTVAPIQFLYAARQGTDRLQEQSLQLLEDVPAEQNSIIAVWQQSNWAPLNAAQSQAMIQLYNNYCTGRKCLDCAIGLSILKST